MCAVSLKAFKPRFRCLLVKRVLHYKPEAAAFIVNACHFPQHLQSGSTSSGKKAGNFYRTLLLLGQKSSAYQKSGKSTRNFKYVNKKSFITSENEDILSSIGVQNREIVKRQILKSLTGHIPKIKYSPELRAFALTLHFYSPKAYNFVRKTFSTCLPVICTLRSWYQSVDGKPGFTKEALDTIKSKAKESDKKIYATIIFDEMAIRSGVEYHPQGRRYYRHVSFGTSLKTDLSR